MAHWAPALPTLLIPAADMQHYQASVGWSWYQPRFQAGNIRDEGWKLHVSCNAGNAAQILPLVLPILRNHNIAHKFLPTRAEVTRNDANAQQQGKVLAIYPDDIVQAFNIVGWIDNALAGHAIRAGSPVIANELPVGNTVVYARYGAYASSILDPNTGNYVNDPIGQTHPAWIQNPWPNYPNQANLAAFPAWPNHTQTGWRRRGR